MSSAPVIPSVAAPQHPTAASCKGAARAIGRAKIAVAEGIIENAVPNIRTMDIDLAQVCETPVYTADEAAIVRFSPRSAGFRSLWEENRFFPKEKRKEKNRPKKWRTTTRRAKRR